MPQTVKWLPQPEKHDFQAAEDYLSLIMAAKRAAEWRRKLTAGTAELTDRATGSTVHIPLDDLPKHVREAVAQAIGSNR